MKREKHEKRTVTVRLTDEEDQVLRRLCMLKKMSKRLAILLVSLKTRPSESFSIMPPKNTLQERRP
jgi:hypothetical protein